MTGIGPAPRFSPAAVSTLLDLPLKDAAKNVVPVAVTAAESVERLRTWATGWRCLDASRPGIYTRGVHGASNACRVAGSLVIRTIEFNPQSDGGKPMEKP